MSLSFPSRLRIGDANKAIGERSRVPRSVRVDELQDHEVHNGAAGCVGRYLCVAVESSEEFLHQAEVDLMATWVYGWESV